MPDISREADGGVFPRNPPELHQGDVVEGVEVALHP